MKDEEVMENNLLPTPAGTKTERPIENTIFPTPPQTTTSTDVLGETAEAQDTADKVEVQEGEINIKNSLQRDVSENPPMVSNVDIIPPPPSPLVQIPSLTPADVAESLRVPPPPVQAVGIEDGVVPSVGNNPLAGGDSLLSRKKTYKKPTTAQQIKPLDNPFRKQTQQQPSGESFPSSSSSPVTKSEGHPAITTSIDPLGAEEQGRKEEKKLVTPVAVSSWHSDQFDEGHQLEGGDMAILPVVTTTSIASTIEKAESVPDNPPSDTDDISLKRDKFKRNLKIGSFTLYGLTIVGGGVAVFFFWPVILPSAAAFVGSILAVYAAYYVGVALLTLLTASTGAVLFALAPFGIHRLSNLFANRRYPNSSPGSTPDPALPGTPPPVGASLEEEIFPSTPASSAVLSGPNPSETATAPLVGEKSHNEEKETPCPSFLNSLPFWRKNKVTESNIKEIDYNVPPSTTSTFSS
jgi:hypothetical protein